MFYLTKQIIILNSFITMSSNFKSVMFLSSQEHYIIELLAKHVRICLNKIEA